jgi:hypothetical protein
VKIEDFIESAFIDALEKEGDFEIRELLREDDF